MTNVDFLRSAVLGWDVLYMEVAGGPFWVGHFSTGTIGIYAPALTIERNRKVKK
jgi:hypothetical protein